MEIKYERSWSCPDCGTEHQPESKYCKCGFCIETDWPTPTESDMGIDPYDY